MKNKSLIIITPPQVMLLLDCCYKTALKELREIRTAVGKKARQLITIEDYCAVRGLDREIVAAELGYTKNTR